MNHSQNAAFVPTVASGPQSVGGVPVERLAALPRGTRIGRYEIIGVLGQGGFGITYHARDTQLGRDIALKEYLPIACAVRQGDHAVLPRSTQTVETFRWGRERFRAEATTLARLESVRGVVAVHDFLEANGTAYMVMALVKGETLDALLRRERRLSPAMLERWLASVLEGLERVHALGFLHRDIKPSNIVIDGQGQPTLIDFGTARLALQDHTQAMTAVFTPGYAPLEQASSAHQGPWTDIYALGATLYHAVTGAPPPNAKDRVVRDTIVPAAQACAGQYPAPLLAGIDAALAVHPQQRPQTIAAWRRMLLPGASATAGVPSSTASRAGALAPNWIMPSPGAIGVSAPVMPAAPAMPSAASNAGFAPPLHAVAGPAPGGTRGGPPLWLIVPMIGLLSLSLVAMVGYMVWEAQGEAARPAAGPPVQQAAAPPRTDTPAPRRSEEATPPPGAGDGPAFSGGSGNPAIANDAVRRAIDDTARRIAQEITRQGGIGSGELKEWCSNTRGRPLIDVVVACTTLITLSRDKPPVVAIIYANRAVAYRDLGEPAAALRDLDKAVALDPDSAELIRARGTIHLRMKQYERAIADFDTAIRLDPRNIDAILGRGNANAERGRIDLALQDYNLATQRNPTVPDPFFNRGRVHLMKRDYQNAVLEFSQAIRLNPTRSAYFAARGGAYALKGDYPLALADLDQAIRLNPRDADSFFNRSGVKLRMGDKAGADADMARAKALNPTIQ